MTPLTKPELQHVLSAKTWYTTLYNPIRFNVLIIAPILAANLIVPQSMWHRFLLILSVFATLFIGTIIADRYWILPLANRSIKARQAPAGTDSTHLTRQ